jgi:hypothetical protein
MIRWTGQARLQPILRLTSFTSRRIYFKYRYLLLVSIASLFFICTRLIEHSSDNQLQSTEQPSASSIIDEFPHIYELNANGCIFNRTQFSLVDLSLNSNDTRPQPTLERLYRLFSKLISYEENFRELFQYLGIFRFIDLSHSLQPFAKQTERFHDLSCHFRQFINISNKNHIELSSSLIVYLKQLSIYLSDGLMHRHATWTHTLPNQITRPVIILAANARFYDTLQASMRSIDQHLINHTIAIYDLGFEPHQLNTVR